MKLESTHIKNRKIYLKHFFGFWLIFFLLEISFTFSITNFRCLQSWTFPKPFRLRGSQTIGTFSGLVEGVTIAICQDHPNFYASKLLVKNGLRKKVVTSSDREPCEAIDAVKPSLIPRNRTRSFTLRSSFTTSTSAATAAGCAP